MRANQQGARRSFLFLQGPPGPFFLQLALRLRDFGHGIHRINLSGGDRYDWPAGATNYRGTMPAWPMYFDRFLRANGITDLVLYGDCRPVHQAAVRMAKLRGVRVFVFEEGYIRPDWMTLERDGVNGHSPFDRDPSLIMASSRWLRLSASGRTKSTRSRHRSAIGNSLTCSSSFPASILVRSRMSLMISSRLRPLPPLCGQCGGVLRPPVVLFEEMLPERAIEALYAELRKGFDAVLAVGTTASFPYIVEPVLHTRATGGFTVEINPGFTDLSTTVDIRLAGRALDVLPRILSHIPSN